MTIGISSPERGMTARIAVMAGRCSTCSRCFWSLALVLFFTAPCLAADHTQPIRPKRNMVESLPVPKFTDSDPDTSFVLPLVEPRPDQTTVSAAPIFLLRDVRFSGNNIFSREELLEVAAVFLDQRVSAADLEELRVRLSNFYISRGYVNSGAILPDQTIQNGTIRYRIIEGMLTDINVEGTGWLRPGYVSSRLHPDRDSALNANQLQEKFQLLLSDPLIERLNGELKPGEAPGEAILDLEVTRSRPYSLVLGFDNYHPPSSGAYELTADGYLRNLTSFGDEFYLHGERSEGAWDITAMFAVPVNRWDTRLFVRFEEGNSEVIEESLDILDIESDYSYIEGGITHPFYRTLRREFLAGISLTSRQSQTYMLGDTFPFSPGVEPDGSAKTSVLRLTQEYTDRSAERVIALRSTFGFGLSMFDATVHEDEADSEFVAWIGQARYARKYDEIDSRLLLRTDMQFASDALLPMERFALGGRYSVRGYRENEMVRDNGFSASAELRYALHGDPERKDNLSIQLAPFIDTGSGWNKSEFDNAKLLLSTGLGVVVNWKDFFAECFLAYAINEPVEKIDYDLQDSGIHFRLSWAPF